MSESDVDVAPAPSASSPSASVAAFDNRDEETKAKFRAMLGGGKKGKKSIDGKRSKSPSISGLPASASASGPALMADTASADSSEAAGNHADGNGTEAAGVKKKTRSPKGSQQPNSESDVSSSASSSLSSMVSNAAHAALERAARIRGAGTTNGTIVKPTAKAAALAALSSRLKHPDSPTTDGASRTNGQPPSLLDPSPSAAASAFSSPNASPPATPKAVAEEDEDESPITVSAAAEETEAEDDDDDEVAADRIEHVEASDAVRNVDRKEHLDAMEKDRALQPTMPWHSSSSQPPTANNTAAPPPASSASSVSLLVSMKGKAKQQQKPSKTSPSSSVSPQQQYGSLVPSPVTSAPTSPREPSASPLADNYDDDASSSVPRSSSSNSLTPYLPFTPSATYFTTAMQPDLTAHGSHIKLILYPIKRQKRKVLLPLQSDQCPQCSTPLRNRMFSRPRYCTYTGLYYCRSCHVKQRCVIPGRVLWFGDVRRYKVCELAFTYLESIYSMPVLPMSAINPSLYRASKRLRYAFLLRQQLVYLRPFIEDCEHREELLVLFGERRYMLNDTPVLSTSSRGLRTSFATIVDASESAAAVSSASPNHSADNARDMYSLRDLMEIIRGQLTEKLSLLVSTLIEHVAHSDCESCGPKGRLCEGDGCVDRVPIYSFQVGNVIGCVDCGCLFHRSCWSGEEGECPHCRRVAAAQQSVVHAHMLASELGGGGVRGYGDDSSRARAYVVDESIGHYE